MITLMGRQFFQAGVGSQIAPAVQPAFVSGISPLQRLNVVFVEEKPVKGLFPGRVTTSIYRAKDGKEFVLEREPQWEDVHKGVNKPGKERVWVIRPGKLPEERIIKTAQFAKKEIAKIASHPKKDGAIAATSWGVASDISAIVRNYFWIRNPIDPNPGVVYGLGYTSAVGMITGPMALSQATAQLKTAQKTKDAAGAVFAKMAIAGGAAETVSGASMAVSRTLSLASLNGAGKAMQTAGALFGWGATIAISLNFLISAIRSGKILRAALNVRKELASKETIDEKFTYLLSKIMLNDEDYQRALQAIDYSDDYDLLKMMTEGVSLTEEELNALTQDDIARIEQEIEDKGIEEPEDIKKHLMVRYKKELAHIKMAKEAEYQRTVGRDSLIALKAANISKAEIVSKVELDLKQQIMKQRILLFALIIGITSFILTSALTGGTMLIIGYLMMFVMNLILTGVDTKAMYESLMNIKELSMRDKLLMALFIIITAAATIAGIVFSGGAILGVPLIIGLLMIAVQGGAMAYAWKKHRPVVEGYVDPAGIPVPVGFRDDPDDFGLDIGLDD